MKSISTRLKIVILGVIVFFTGPWLLLYISISLTEDPPKPFYTYGEFPFHLEYEINGQEKTVEDTVIVKFDGFGLSEGSGRKYIQWKKTLASGNKNVVLYEGGKGEDVSLFFSVLYLDYHLEDELYNEDALTPGVIKKMGNITDHSPLSEYELLTEYNLKVINFEYGESIKK